MAEIKWIKITTDIFDDEKMLLIESMPEADSLIVIWFKLLTFAGKSNNNGVFMLSEKIPYTEEMLATIFRRPINTVRLALSTFEQFGMIEYMDNVLTIPKWEKHQNIDGMDKIREQNRKRVAEHRAKQKLLSGNVTSNVTVTQSNAIDKEEDKDKNKKKNKDNKSEENLLMVCELLGKHDYSLFGEAQTGELQAAILSFIEFRKGIKKPMTEKAVDLLIGKLKKLSSSIPEQIEILNQSIVNGWTGLYPLKTESVNNGFNRNRAGDKQDSARQEYGVYL